MNEALPRSAAAPGISPYLIAAVVAFGTFLETLDSTALAVALPAIAGGLAAGTEESDLVLTSYLVANAAIMPISGWAATFFGRKRYYITCVALFTLSSLMCAMAWSVESLVLFRIIQGAAAAGNAASEASIIADSFTPKKRGIGFAIYGIAVVVGPTIGPVVGGYFADNHSWRWIFWINLPIGLLAVVLSSFLLVDRPAVREATRKARAKGLRLDWLGFFLAIVGLGMFEIVLDEGQSQDWFASPVILISAVVAAVCLVALPLWELTRKDPVVDVRLFRHRSFAVACVALFVTAGGLIGVTTLFPLMLQQVFRYDATTAGLALALGGATVFLAMPIVGSLTGKVPTAILIGSGLSITAISLYQMSAIYLDYSFWQLALIRAFQGLGFGLLFVPLQSHAYIGVPPERNEQASALLNLSRNMGGSVGIAIGITLLERGRQGYRDRLTDYLDPLNPNFQDFARESGGSQYDPGFLAQLEGILLQQASILSYERVFFVYAVVAALSLALVLLFRGKPSGMPQG